jgi:hypothetical protein
MIARRDQRVELDVRRIAVFAAAGDSSAGETENAEAAGCASINF